MQTGPAHLGVNTVTMFVVVFLVVLGAVGGYWAYGAVFQPTAAITPTSYSTTSASGVRLALSINASTITDAQSLNVSLSIFNTHPSVESIATSNQWVFTGVPVAYWGLCSGGGLASMLVVKGDLTLQELRSDDNTTSAIMSAGAGLIDHVIFNPSSDEVNATGVFNAGNSEVTIGPYHTAVSFTTDGAWNLLNFDRLPNQPVIGNGLPPPPVYAAFAPGVYTIAADDEWGQAVVLQVAVVASTTTGTTTSSNSVTTASISNTSSWLELGINVRQSGIGNITIAVDESNLLYVVNNVTQADEWKYAQQSLDPCGTNLNPPNPVEFALVQGRFGTNNYTTSGGALPLYDPGNPYTCARATFSGGNVYAFQPLNDSFSFPSGTALPDHGTASVTISTNGYWTGGQDGVQAAFKPFSSGVYTVIGADEWGNVVLLQFSVP